MDTIPEFLDIETLPEDIEGAKRGDTFRCPVARAVKRIIDADWVVSVTRSDIRIYDPVDYRLTGVPTYYALLAGTGLDTVIENYDQGLSMFPEIWKQIKFRKNIIQNRI
jgi:hypothetical protein